MTLDDRGNSVVEIQLTMTVLTVSVYFHCVKNERTILLLQNKLVLLPGLAPGPGTSKSLLPPKKMNF